LAGISEAGREKARLFAVLEREFQFTRRIVDSVPAALLSLPNDLSKLRLVHDAIVADAA
jgi:hypothetical protein